MIPEFMQLDVVIFGGGAAGLWLLDALSEQGHRVLLLEATALGHGQTIASQGIIHGGLKYTLQGLMNRSAEQIRDMPELWRQSLRDRRRPHLAATRMRSDDCFLWRTENLRSRLGLIGARWGLRITPQKVAKHERPHVLRHCPGVVSRLPEPVISPHSFLESLREQHRDAILKIDAGKGLRFECDAPGSIRAVQLQHPTDRSCLTLNPRTCVFTAGSGNQNLRQLCGLTETALQLRPLHMVMVRGQLPTLNGHCVDGARTRVTITSDSNHAGQTVWQLGGQVAEDGVSLDSRELIEHAGRELQSAVPGLDLSQTSWSTYRVDRAEGVDAAGQRPSGPCILSQGNTITVWPTKLALAPQAAAQIRSQLPSPTVAQPLSPNPLADWPCPAIAQPPWETQQTWTPWSVHGIGQRSAA
ncbi:MAG: FAD-dependent oxidoreductase, partial [Planctomycetaceae bacterium]